MQRVELPQPLPPLILGILILFAGVARAEGVGALDRLAEGAPIYALVRPARASAAAGRLSLEKSADYRAIKGGLGVDPLDARLLAPTGIDVSAPVAAALFEPVEKGTFFHHRVVATIVDRSITMTFLDGMASSKAGQVVVHGEKSREGRAGVRASMALPEGGLAILRVEGDALVIDAATPWDGKGPGALELAKRFPLAPGAPFSRAGGKGARRLFAPEAAVVVYADGRRFPSLMVPLRMSEIRFGIPEATSAADLRRLRAKEKATAVACQKEWSKVPPVFDEVAASVTADAEGVVGKIGWGSPSSAGLKVQLSDDAPLDFEGLARGAMAGLAFRMGDAGSVASLPLTGPFAPSGTVDSLSAAVDRCGTLAWSQLLVRHWPQVLAVMVSQLTGVGAAKQPIVSAVLGRLRNVELFFRDLTEQGPQWAVAGTFEPAARQAVELFFAAAGQPETLTFGKRQPGVYPLNMTGLSGGVLALEDVPGGKFLAVAADSAKTLEWVYGAKAPAAEAAPTVGALRVEGERLARLASLFNQTRETSPLVDCLARAGRIGGEVTDEGDLFLFTVRAALK